MQPFPSLRMLPPGLSAVPGHHHLGPAAYSAKQRTEAAGEGTSSQA